MIWICWGRWREAAGRGRGAVTTLMANAPHAGTARAASETAAGGHTRAGAAGVPVHVNVAPIIPAITDHEIEAILDAAAEAGAVSASYIPVRLPHEVAPLFREWLDAHFRDRAGKVMAIIRSPRRPRQ